MKIVRAIMLIMFFAASIMIPDMVINAQAEDILLFPEGNSDETDLPRQRTPAYSPVYCVVGEESITIFSRYEAVGLIRVSDATGVVVVSASGELSGGYTVDIAGGVTSGMTIRVTIDTHSYSATI